MRETFDFLALGGPVMIVLGVLSVVALTLFIERLVSTQRRRIIPERFTELLGQHLRRGRLSDARVLCESNDSPISALALAALAEAGRGREIIRQSVAERGRREAVELERFVGGIGSIASIAPLLGLLGTITGMISTFRQVDATVSAAGQVSPGAFASGIWEALLTTAAGLLVAIPTFAVYKFLLARVDRLTLELEERASEIADLVDRAEENAGTARAQDAANERDSESDAGLARDSDAQANNGSSSRDGRAKAGKDGGARAGRDGRAKAGKDGGAKAGDDGDSGSGSKSGVSTESLSSSADDSKDEAR